MTYNWDDGDIWDDEAVWDDTSPSLLPSNATPAERALELAMSRLSEIPVPIASLWSSADCPADVLPWLAHAMSVDAWKATWTTQTKRNVIAQSIDVHRHKGTVGAVKKALVAAGLGDATLIERAGATLLDGSRTLDGSWTLSPADHWAEYRVELDRPMTNEQADQVREILADVAPLHCALVSLDFRQVGKTLDGSWLLDGSYNLGEA